MSQDAVVNLAQAYLRKLNGPPTASVLAADSVRVDPRGWLKIQCHPADKAPDDPTNQDILAIVCNHPHPYWQVEQPGQYKMEVDDATGRVKFYMNSGILNKRRYQPAGRAIIKSRALWNAEYAIKATGETLDNLALANIQERQDNQQPQNLDHEWDIFWLRTYHGVPYRREGARVALAAETGEIISVGVDAQSIDPVTSAQNVTQEQALSVAEAQLKAVGLPLSDLPLMSVTKQVDPYNTLWRNGDETHHTRQTRVVWNCHFGTFLDGYEVWVDTETGDVIGGLHDSALSGGGKVLNPQFGHQVKYKELSAMLIK